MKIITKGRIMILLGILCFGIAANIVVHNQSEDLEAGVSAAGLLEEVEAQVTNAPIEKNPRGAMKSVDVNGQSFVGIIEIPAIDIRLPIQTVWSSQNAKTAPCRYKGSVYENNLIVAGHNYQRHFGNLKNLLVGDEIIVTDVDGRQYHYEVTYIEDIGTYEVDKMDEGTWDFTVFTCTIGGASRVTVRCDFVKMEAPGSGESITKEIEEAVTAE